MTLANATIFKSSAHKMSHSYSDQADYVSVDQVLPATVRTSTPICKVEHFQGQQNLEKLGTLRPQAHTRPDIPASARLSSGSSLKGSETSAMFQCHGKSHKSYSSATKTLTVHWRPSRHVHQYAFRVMSLSVNNNDGSESIRYFQQPLSCVTTLSHNPMTKGSERFGKHTLTLSFSSSSSLPTACLQHPAKPPSLQQTLSRELNLFVELMPTKSGNTCTTDCLHCALKSDSFNFSNTANTNSPIQALSSKTEDMVASSLISSAVVSAKSPSPVDVTSTCDNDNNGVSSNKRTDLLPQCLNKSESAGGDETPMTQDVNSACVPPSVTRDSSVEKNCVNEAHISISDVPTALISPKAEKRGRKTRKKGQIVPVLTEVTDNEMVLQPTDHSFSEIKDVNSKTSHIKSQKSTFPNSSKENVPPVTNGSSVSSCCSSPSSPCETTAHSQNPPVTSGKKSAADEMTKNQRREYIMYQRKTLRRMINDTYEKTAIASEEKKALKEKAGEAWKKDDLQTVMRAKMSINLLKTTIKEAKRNQQKFFKVYQSLHEELLSDLSQQPVKTPTSSPCSPSTNLSAELSVC